MSDKPAIDDASATTGESADNVLQFKKKKPAEIHKGKSLCRHGFHKWIVKQEKQFDVKRGKLVTLYKCSRCGKEKTELT